jgi:hypothetical protein
VKHLSAFGQSGEGIGLIAGLLMFAAWHLLAPSEFNASLLLAVIVFLSSGAALIVGGCCRRAGGVPDAAVKKGVVGAATAAIVAAACFALLEENSKSPSQVLSRLVAGGLSILPSMFAGMLIAALAALSFATKPGANSDDPALRPALPKAFDWSVRATIALLVARGLAAPFFAHVPTSTPRPIAAPPPVPAKPSFAFTPSAELASAHALQWSLASRRSIGRTNGRAIAFTRDERWVAFIEEKSSRLRIADIFSSEVKTPLVLPFAAGRLAFNPEGDKVFAVSAAEPLLAGVADVAKGRYTVLPKPKEHAIPEGDSFWIDDGTVLMTPPNGARMTVNLNSLETDPSPGAVPSSLPPWRVRLDDRSTWNASPVTGRGKWQVRMRITSAELPETTGTSEWQLRGLALMAMTDPDRNCAVLIPGMEIADGDLYFPSRDASRIVRLRDNALEAFYFGLRPGPALVWTLSMPHGPEESPKGPEIVSQINSGKLLALVYAPMVNPLTGKLVGPDRARVKGSISFKAWTGMTAEVTLVEEFQPFLQGDVVADIYTPAAHGFELHQLRLPHRWWTALPEAGPYSSAPDSIPTFAEFRRREEASRQAAREAGEKERERKVAAEEVSAVPPPRPPLSREAVEKEISEFLTGHHLKATLGDLNGLVQDYAERVDHFNNGIKDRAFIYSDEVKYHQGLKSLEEKMDGNPSIQALGDNRFEVHYTMRNSWVAKNGKRGGIAVKVTLELVRTPSGWQITKHRSEEKH